MLLGVVVNSYKWRMEKGGEYGNIHVNDRPETFFSLCFCFSFLLVTVVYKRKDQDGASWRKEH